jgi:hypothetical protein
MRRSCFQTKAFSRPLRPSSTTSGPASCNTVSLKLAHRKISWFYDKGEGKEDTSKGCSTSGMYFSVAIFKQVQKSRVRNNKIRRDPSLFFLFFFTCFFPRVILAPRVDVPRTRTTRHSSDATPALGYLGDPISGLHLMLEGLFLSPRQRFIHIWLEFDYRLLLPLNWGFPVSPHRDLGDVWDRLGSSK